MVNPAMERGNFLGSSTAGADIGQAPFYGWRDAAGDVRRVDGAGERGGEQDVVEDAIRLVGPADAGRGRNRDGGRRRRGEIALLHGLAELRADLRLDERDAGVRVGHLLRVGEEGEDPRLQPAANQSRPRMVSTYSPLNVVLSVVMPIAATE
jgi:hypothetical protein